MYALVQGGSVIAYPYSASQLRQDNPNVSFPSPLTDEVRAEFGVLPVEPVAVPDGKVSVAVTAGYVEGVLKEVHTLEDMPLADRKAALRAAVNVKLNAVLTGGYTVQTGPMAGKVLQTRNIEDRTNWLVSQASYSAAVAGGQGATLNAKFRTADNATFTLSYADGLNVLLAMAAWGAAAMDNSWSLKDAIEAAVDAAALEAIDVDAGWPEQA
jgi:hypothetical protein